MVQRCDMRYYYKLFIRRVAHPSPIAVKHFLAIASLWTYRWTNHRTSGDEKVVLPFQLLRLRLWLWTSPNDRRRIPWQLRPHCVHVHRSFVLGHHQPQRSVRAQSREFRLAPRQYPPASDYSRQCAHLNAQCGNAKQLFNRDFEQRLIPHLLTQTCLHLQYDFSHTQTSGGEVHAIALCRTSAGKRSTWLRSSTRRTTARLRWNKFRRCGTARLLRGRCGTVGYVAPKIMATDAGGGYGNNVDIYSVSLRRNCSKHAADFPLFVTPSWWRQLLIVHRLDRNQTDEFRPLPHPQLLPHVEE